MTMTNATNWTPLAQTGQAELAEDPWARTARPLYAPPVEIGGAGGDLDAAFYNAWADMGRRLGIDPLAIAKVAHAESGMNARAFHPGSQASGLIGFMPFILRGLGWTGTPEAFRQLSAREQIPYVEAYYRAYAGQLQGADEGLVYVVNFLPARLGRARAGQPLTQAGENYYDQNRVLDRNGDGAITTDDLRQHLAVQNRGARYEAIDAELRARGGGARPGGSTGGIAARLRPLLPVVAVGGALAWYFYKTDAGRALRTSAEARLNQLVRL